VLAELLETGRTIDGLAPTKMLLCREAFRGRLNALFRDIDLLIMPAMNVAAPTLADMTPARVTPAAMEARLRFTAPFDMSGHPTLTLPGNKTRDGLSVGSQIVGRHLDEALVLRAGHAFQHVTEWHRRRPPIVEMACRHTNAIHTICHLRVSARTRLALGTEPPAPAHGPHPSPSNYPR
jgi:amidase